ncbi:oxygenase MpaB family protein [Trinickia acidisoli]|uniref:oxygenase MpaB family protein n=1 Tax=Trinickia acidisoli TaxID=2767482 RepID=UPI001A8ED7A9|nr:oxygenase MpaB family protein [Trinickia acidisoli]
MSESAGQSGNGNERNASLPAFVVRLRERISQSVLSMTSGSGPTLDYTHPPGDPGLFGPDSVCWQVHADFTSMMIGGISALMLQALHPLALAGVWDHSTFRTDMRGRLRRTATFIAGTTYGAHDDALALIERVKRIHLSVTGVAPDGRPYRASDPALLTWVHVAEVSSFLAAHLRYVNPSLSSARQDRYYAEVALIAKLLGATDVPETRAQVAEYLSSMRPELEAGPRTHEVVRVLRHAAPPDRPLMQPAVRLMLNAGVDLLPDWAQQMLGFTRFARMQAVLARPGVRLVGPFIRWAHVNAVSKRARRRAASAPDA